MPYVLITGATGGLGRELAKYYASQQRPVLLVARNTAALNQLAEKLGNNVDKFALNLANRSEVAKMFDFGCNRFGRVALVINAVGAGRFGPLSELTKEALDANLDANLLPLLWVCQRAVTDMAEHGGLIVNVLSSAARTGRSNEVAYCISKWAARGLSEVLQAATKGTATRIMTVYPGGMKTEFWQRAGFLPKDLSSFMSPSAVANVIIENISASVDNLQVDEIIVSRHT
jgi:short-subunit dehydrogenase